MDDAERMQSALFDAFERLCGVLEGAKFERRRGYIWVVCPPVPVPQFSGVWPTDDSAASELERALAEIAAVGLPYSVQTRRGRTPACEEEARRLALTAEEPMPGMMVTPAELRDADVPDVEIVRVATADGLAQALAVSTAGFGATPELFAPLYSFEVADLEGLSYYLARADGKDVSTAIGYTLGGTVGIFNVATPPEHRGRGYGAAVTAAAARDGFGAGADTAWLQSSTMGHSMYQRLGFRDVETYVLHTAPEAVHP